MFFSDKNNIPDGLNSLEREGISAEKIEKLMELMSKNHPKVSINRTFQSELRSKLLTGSTIQKSPILWHFSRPQIFSLVSAVCASFLMVFGFWQVFFPPLAPHMDPTKNPEEPIPLISHTPVISEKSLEVPSTKIQTSSPKTLSKNDDVDREIANITDDLADISDMIPISPPSQPNPTSLAILRSVPTPSVSSDTPQVQSYGIAPDITIDQIHTGVAPVVASSAFTTVAVTSPPPSVSASDADIDSEIGNIAADIDQIVDEFIRSLPSSSGTTLTGKIQK